LSAAPLGETARPAVTLVCRASGSMQASFETITFQRTLAVFAADNFLRLLLYGMVCRILRVQPTNAVAAGHGLLLGVSKSRHTRAHIATGLLGVKSCDATDGEGFRAATAADKDLISKVKARALSSCCVPELPKLPELT